MSYYDYDKFVHPVPPGFLIPAHTPMRRAESPPNPVETFIALDYDHTVFTSDEVKFYLTYDITAPQLPEKINTVIYNVRAGKSVYPVAVYQGDMLWSVFSALGKLGALYSPEIKSFDTTPPKEEPTKEPDHD